METGAILASIMRPTYVVVGLSLLFHAKSWKHLLDKYQKDHFQLFPDMLFSMILGLIVIYVKGYTT